MNYPKELIKKAYNHGDVTQSSRFTTTKYTFVKEYEHYALYVDEQGNRECFQPFDCGLIDKRNLKIDKNFYETEEFEDE